MRRVKVLARPNRVWIVDDDRSIRWVLEKALSRNGMETRSFDSGTALLDVIEGLSASSLPDAVLTDVRMPGIDGMALMDKLHALDEELPVIVMTAHSDLDSAVSAYHSGAFEYLPKPFDVDEASALAQRACEHRRSKHVEPPPDAFDEMPEIIGEAPAMQEVFRAIGRLSRSNITVLINGESGTGKELVAQALHRHSPRADRAFIALNMAAIPKDLMESELFGHEKGAFTGAQALRQGRFEQADGGTLFLDEIGDMPPDLQTRLLRVLADGVFYRVGGHAPVRADVRIIAATHQNLEEKVKRGEFRDDLFHRLNVIRIKIPALRERSEDIPMLARHYLSSCATELEVEPKVLDTEAEQALMQFDWPGNVRQLVNSCRWITVMATGREVKREDLPEEILSAGKVADGSGNDWRSGLRRHIQARIGQGEREIADAVIHEAERILMDCALDNTRGHRQEAAKLLGWGRNTLTRKLKGSAA